MDTGMPDSHLIEVGLIPADWEVKRLESVADPKRPICYGIVQVGPFVSDGKPVLAIKNLGTDYFSNVHRCSPKIEALYARSRVRPGDVLISVKGTVGRIGIVPVHFTGNISRDLARLSLTAADVPEFWFQLLQSETAKRMLDIATVGTTRMELSIGILKQVRMPRPPKHEQQAIARSLGDMDGQILSLERLISKKQAIKLGMAQELMGKQSLTGILSSWRQMRVADVVTRSFSGPSPIRVLAGDSIITKAGPRHRVGVPAFVRDVEPRIIPSGKMICLRPYKTAILPGFLALALADRRTQAYLDQRTTGMAESQVNFENRDLLEAPIWVPDIEHQHRILEPLENMDRLITALRDQIAKVREVKQGMMQELLTGRIRLVSPEANE